MNIYWCTTRHFQRDLCATTQVAIIKKFISSGHSITVLGPDMPQSDHEWEHIQIGQSTIRGRKASSLAKNIREHIDGKVAEHDILFVDWPMVGVIAPFAEKNNIRWLCIDRSPPADANIYAKLQNHFWKKAWNMVGSSIRKNGTCIGGMVVSRAHKKLVLDWFPMDEKRICVVHAGFDNSIFKHQEHKNGQSVGLVYHGKMDRNRGILKLVLLLDALIERGINARLNLIGSGDLDAHLHNLSSSHNALTFHGLVPHEQIPTLLQMNTIGLLPMPELPTWKIASPLKRSEYLGSGLLVLGIDHAGHQLPINLKDANWYSLFEQQSFVADSVNQIENWIQNGRISQLSKQARLYAETYLDWNITTQPLLQWLENL